MTQCLTWPWGYMGDMSFASLKQLASFHGFICVTTAELQGNRRARFDLLWSSNTTAKVSFHSTLLAEKYSRSRNVDKVGWFRLLCGVLHVMLQTPTGDIPRKSPNFFSIAIYHSTDGLQIFVCLGYTYGDAKWRRWAKRALEWQPACEKGGQETKHMGHEV